MSAIARKLMQGRHADQYLQLKQSPPPHIIITVIYFEWLLSLWLCGVLASGPTSTPQPCNSTLAMPPVNQLNSLRTPTEFATSQPYSRSGSAALPASVIKDTS